MLLIFIRVPLLYNAVLASAYTRVSCTHMYTNPLFFGFPSHLVHYGAWSRVPCVPHSRFSFMHVMEEGLFPPGWIQVWKFYEYQTISFTQMYSKLCNKYSLSVF